MRDETTAARKAARKKHYENNKKYYYDKAQESKQRKREYVQAKKDVPCADCGIRYPYYVMDFDHREGEAKVLAVSQLLLHAGFAKLDAEIAKCDVVCSNCHRERTWQRMQKGDNDAEMVLADCAISGSGFSG